MARFNVGDRVVGNVNANKYGITRCGWRGKVVKLETDPWRKEIADILVEGEDDFGCISRYWVNSACFDLDKSDAESPSHLDDRAEKRDGRPYKRRVVIGITDDGAEAKYIVGKNVAKQVTIKRFHEDKPDDKYAALYAVSKLFGINASKLKNDRFISAQEIDDIDETLVEAMDRLCDVKDTLRKITAAGR